MKLVLSDTVPCFQRLNHLYVLRCILFVLKQRHKIDKATRINHCITATELILLSWTWQRLIVLIS